MIIHLDDLALDAPDGRPLLRNLHLSLEPGANLLILGPSGCGKSQLMKVIAGTERPRDGRVVVGGAQVWPGEGALALAGRVRVGQVFTRGGLLSNLTLLDNVALPLRFAGVAREQAVALAETALHRMGLEAMADHRPHAVTVHARRLANLARTLALEPDLILVDEPLEGVDSSDRPRVLALIEDWAADPRKSLVLALEEAGPFEALDARRLHLMPVNPLIAAEPR